MFVERFQGFSVALVGVLITLASKPARADGELPYNAMGERVGEVTATTARVHTRLTLRPEPDADGGSPGKDGYARVFWGEGRRSGPEHRTEWVRVTSETGHFHQFVLTALKPDTRYRYHIEMSLKPGGPARRGATGQFRTAPAANDWEPVRFCVITGQAYKDHDEPGGFRIYRSMAALKPHFLVSTGDNVYYDSEPPFTNNVEIARFHWQRMYGQRNLVDFFREFPGYWEKDDHDYRHDDSDPYTVFVRGGRELKTLSHEEGVRLFREVVPVSTPTYRTFRWGKGLQVWFTEGRDYRSPNAMPDGPDKTLWGAEQMAWLKRTLLESDAEFKVLISPTPTIGPDRQTKRDNHCDRDGFWTEGRAFLRWAAEEVPSNFYLACGDRHWQYHSIDETGLMEFSCGPVSDQHAVHSERSAPRAAPRSQPFYRLLGGFLSVTVEPPAEGLRGRAYFRFHDVEGRVLYEYATETLRVQAGSA